MAVVFEMRVNRSGVPDAPQEVPGGRLLLAPLHIRPDPALFRAPDFIIQPPDKRNMGRKVPHRPL